MRLNLLFVLAFVVSMLHGQNLPPKQAYPYTVKQIHSGHSLTDPLFYPHWPGQYVYLMSELRGNWAGDDIAKSTIPGSPLRYRWDNSSGDTDARHNINKYELLCITEGANLCHEGGSTQAWYLDCIKEQKQYLTLFVNNAWNNGNGGNGAATLLYSNWVNINGENGPFREMLDKLGGEWERMQDYANANKPTGATNVYMIPGHKMMAKMYDDVQAGIVPGITQFSQFFSDNIHVNELGGYAVAMLHYACIYNKNPLGLPNKLIENPPAGTPIPSPALAEYIQKMVWQVVTSYERTGVRETVSSSKELEIKQTLCVYPNPASQNINICSDLEIENNDTYIYDSMGRCVLKTNENQINVDHLDLGFYILRNGNAYAKFMKN